MGTLSTGSSITFGTTSYGANAQGMEWDGPSVPTVDTTHLGTTGFRTKIPGELQDGGEWTLDYIHDPDEQPPVGVSQTITITQNAKTGQSSGATIAFTGFVSKWNVSIPSVDSGEDKMTSNITIVVGDDVTYTDGSA